MHQSGKQFGFRSGPTFCWPDLEIQTVCKCYQQSTLVGKELKSHHNLEPTINAIQVSVYEQQAELLIRII